MTAINVCRELAKIIGKMVKYGIARSRLHDLSIVVREGISSVFREIEFWDRVYGKVKELEERKYRVRHGSLSKLLEEDRG